ncbi:sigma-70 family RNA polymerase sigma factor [Pseudobacillus badius]|uniref:sigma-70 family RNA polymerase sigma factor n=1 Tax=Bacillus badius TaxID=1455 RepID=UPI003CF47325
MERSRKCELLVELVLAGDQTAYGKIYEETVDDVYKTVHFLMDHKSDIDDVVQEIYLQAYGRLKTFDLNRNFRPWLIGIAVRQVRAYRRKRWTHLRIARKAEQYKALVEEDFSHRIVDKVSNRQLLISINQLSFKLRQVVILRYLHDYSQEEIADSLNIPIGTVKSRVNAALKKLRQSEMDVNIFFMKVGNIQ